MTLTKQDIDALWAAHRARIKGSIAMNQEDTYLAAGLTASGERKPERVRCVRIVNPEYPADNHFWAEGGEDLFPPHYQVTPGWFVPDGAE